MAWFSSLRPDVQFTIQLFLFTFWRDFARAQLLSCSRAAARGLPRDVYGTYCVCAGRAEIPARAAELSPFTKTARIVLSLNVIVDENRHCVVFSGRRVELTEAL